MSHKKLFFAIAWLEYARNKTRIWLLIGIVLACVFGLSTCSAVNTKVQMASEFSQSVESGSAKVEDIVVFKKILNVVPAFLVVLLSFFLGFLLLIWLPLRSKEEWESGQFQMIAMGDFSFYKIQVARFAVYFFIAAVFFALVIISFNVYGWEHALMLGETSVVVNLAFAYRFISLVPLFLGLSLLLSAVDTAYYRDSNSRILTLAKYLGCLSFFVLILKASYWLETKTYILVQPLWLPIEVSGIPDTKLSFSWEFLAISLLITVGFVVWSAKILEDVEA